ncbi:MAG: polysaccharide deacetylase family protein [Epsilonproteobacteria bacterium]|nr:polysaccharide deacetylase family protein [Campylobacterota bacterium]
MQPKQWGENVSGVATKFNTQKKEIALTFDACGGSPFSRGYDKELIDFLILHKIPATLFLNAGWIEANHDTFKELKKNQIFEIANHGTKHKPLSINGKSIYGLNGTKSKQEVLEEVEDNNKLLQSLNQKRPLFFRSGTAYYDEIAVDIIRKELNVEIAGFSINSDAGATYNKDTIIKELISAKSGDIVIAHMNHPEGFTAEGFMVGLKILKEKGFSFVKLSDIKNNLIRIP